MERKMGVQRGIGGGSKTMEVRLNQVEWKTMWSGAKPGIYFRVVGISSK